MGRGDGGWDGRADAAAAPGHGPADFEARAGAGHAAGGDGVHALLGHSSHHELSFLPRLQEIGADWTEKCAAGTVKSPLKTLLLMDIAKELKTRLEAFRDDTERLESAMTTGWISQGSTQMDPVWHYDVWNPKEKKQERSDQHPVATTALLASLEILFQNIPAPGVIQRFRSTKGLDENYDDVEVAPFLLWVGLRSNQARLLLRIAVSSKWNPARLWLFPSLLTLTAQKCGMSPSEWGLSSSMLGIRLIRVITKLPAAHMELPWHYWICDDNKPPRRATHRDRSPFR